MSTTTSDPGLTAVTIEPDPQASARVIQTSLTALRQHLGMDVAFVGRFQAGRRRFDFVDADSADSPVQVGMSDPLEDTYCARVVDGRLPGMVRDAREEPAVADLPVTQALPVGAHLSVPLLAADGEVFGTLCCFSHQADPTLRDRDVQLLRMFSDLVSIHLEALVEHEDSQESARGHVATILDRGGPMMAMQPIVDLTSGEVTGYEALARFPAPPAWSPQQWFSEAQRVGLGADLEVSAVAAALQILPRLPRLTSMAVNVSAASLFSPELIGLLTCQDAARLVVEVTEHEQVENYDAIAEPLSRLRAAGARIAVDDAGSGYAGLQHILQLQPEVLKLDRKLVDGIAHHDGRQALAEAMVGFAGRMAAVVVAEGVETSEDLDALRRIGVHFAQGYLLGRPSLQFAQAPAS